MKICPHPGCPNLTNGGRCPEHQPKDTRPSAARRGYGASWRRKRAAFLRANPTCDLCGAPSQVPDHHPLTRRQLTELGVQDPDHPTRLRPLCNSCHSKHTAEHDGAFGRPVTPPSQRR